jgi:nucleoside-diphosphate-sugar epimerase
MYKILITGGLGYIGSTLVPQLLERGHSVTVVDSGIYTTDSLITCAKYTNFSFIRGDVRDIELMKQLVKKVDIIIPLAALVGAPLCDRDPFGAKSINRDSVIALFNLASNNQLIIMPTTNSAYGTSKGEIMLDENAPLNPISEYARGKVDIEKSLMDRENSVSFRLATVFGASPRMRTDLLVNDFVYRSYFDNLIVLYEGDFKRNYIHVRDVARAIEFSISDSATFVGNIFNVGLSSANISKRELCEKIKIFIPELNIIEGFDNKDPDQRNYLISNSKLESTGFIPKVTIEEGIKELLRLYSMIKNIKYGNV